MIIDPVAVEQMIPRSGGHVLAAVLFPLMLGLSRRTPAPFLPTSGTVMKGRMLRRTPSLRSGFQPMGCFCERFPADEDVVRRFAFEDQFQALLEGLGGVPVGLAAPSTPSGDVLLLAVDPVAQVGVDQGFQRFVSSLW